MEHLPDATAAPFGSFAPDALTRLVLGAADLDLPRSLGRLRRKIGRFWLRQSRRIYDLTFRGFRLRLHPATNAGDMSIVLDGTHIENEELDLAAERVAGCENFIDIGANIGLYALIAARNLPAGRPVLAFEPAPDTASRLRTNLAFNGANSVQVIEAALGDKAGQVVLMRRHTNIRATSAINPHVSDEEIAVPCLCLPEVLAERGVTRIGMLKIDIEGFEDRALMPVLDRMPPEAWPRYILMEVKHSRHWKRDVVAEFMAKGYHEVYRDGRNVHLAAEGEKW